jgi:hypothetical protein
LSSIDGIIIITKPKASEKVLLGFFKIFQQKTNNKKLHEKVCTTWVYTKCYAFIQEGQLALGWSQ